jgi:hypothetical protein
VSSFLKLSVLSTGSREEKTDDVAVVQFAAEGAAFTVNADEEKLRFNRAAADQAKYVTNRATFRQFHPRALV